MKSIILEPLKNRTWDGKHTRRCLVKRMDGLEEVDQRELWFQFPNSINPPDNSDCDSYVLSTVMDAMKEGRKLIVQGATSKRLLSNLTEYQSAWNKWRPNTYDIIDIEVEDATNEIEAVPGAICAFSGGLDSTFSVWRHSQRRNGYRTYNINLCSLIHGFDIPLSDVNAFNNTQNNVRITLNDVNLNMLPIATNYREITSANWAHAHMTAIVAALSHFKSVAGTCLIPSSYPYSHLYIPWGSTPIIDHLLSSAGFDVIHDGASHFRTEKANEIAEWKLGVENLRVCWQGIEKDRNCGKCEKCTRTMFNFLASGHPIPACFPKCDDLNSQLKKIVIKHDGILGDWQQVLEYAKAHQMQDSWVRQLSRIIKRYTIYKSLLPQGSVQNRLVMKLQKLVEQIDKTFHRAYCITGLKTEMTLPPKDQMHTTSHHLAQ